MFTNQANPTMLKVKVAYEGDSNGDGGFETIHTVSVADVEAHHQVVWADQDEIDQMSLAEDYALYAFHRRYGDQRLLRADVVLDGIAATHA